MTKAQIKEWLESKAKRHLKTLCKNADLELPKDVKTNPQIIDFIIEEIDHAELCELQAAEPEKKSLNPLKGKTVGEVAKGSGKWVIRTVLLVAVAAGGFWIGKKQRIETGDSEEVETADDMSV